jgi:NADH-quinone oxidoreductase subunit H
MVIKILELIAAVILAFIIGILFLGLFRKIVARIHWRYGPPIIQPLLDIFKLFHQKGFSHGFVFSLGIIISLAASIVLVLFIPFGGLSTLETSGGLFVILYIMLIKPLGIALSGGEGANPNISIGISRKLILSLGYEVPLLLILISTMTYYKTISIVEIVNAQGNFQWSLFSPLCLSGLAYFIILPAILEIRPFDIASAPQEISSGPAVEYSGRYLALYHIEHAFSLFISIAIFVDLFLGGGANPFYFFLKMMAVFVLGAFIHAVFPRFRTEQAIRYLWLWPAAMALVGLIIILIMKVIYG